VKRRIYQQLFFIGLLMLCVNVLAQNDPLVRLLEQVKQSRQMQTQRDLAREKRFLAVKETREARLKAIKQALQKEQARQQELEAHFQSQQTELGTLHQKLKENSGTYGELFSVVRQVASENLNLFKQDITSAMRQDDLPILDKIANSRSLPSIKRLEAMWELFLQRIVLSGHIWRASLPVIHGSGEEHRQRVTGIGLFNALSDGDYLRYLPETGRFVALGRQPAPRYQIMAKALEEEEERLQRIAIDPSRGAILALLVQSPTFFERIQQGGYIGYLILALGLLGGLVVIERLIILTLVWRRVKRQQQQPEPSMDNPLGRLLNVAQAHPQLATDDLQKHMDDAILKELPKLRRGLRALAIFAAVAPLLGLLGTVTGMIETFQSISLFGTGDPKLMSGGISQALVTTELGLAVAIPLVLLHSFLSGQSNRVIRLLDQQSASMTATRTGF
jgi:biopolymer transport protein ExbB